MSTRSTLALLTFAAAAAISVATSPPQWEIEADADGAELLLDASAPSATMHVDVDAAEIPDEAYGELTVWLTMGELLADDEGHPATIDAVLVQETDDGDVELATVTGWTDGTDEQSNLSLTAGDLAHESATYRVDVELVDGGSASFVWNARVRYEIRGDAANGVEGEPSLSVVVDPAPAEEL